MSTPAAGPHRLFIALWPDEAVRAALHARQQAWRWPAGARLVAPEHLHVTLHFLGAVETVRAAALAPALDVAFEPFVVEVGAPAVWHGGIAVLEAAVVPDLAALHESLGRALLAQGFEAETRPYRPHATLARRAEGAVAPPGLPPIAWRVDGFALVRSAGGRYEVLLRYPLTSAIASRPKSGRSR